MASSETSGEPIVYVGGGMVQGDAYIFSSIYMQGTFINHLLRSASASGSVCYLALYNQDVSDPDIPPQFIEGGIGLGLPIPIDPPWGGGGGGGGVPLPPPTEISGGGYSRYDMQKFFTISSAGSAFNSNNILIGPATSDWGTVTHIGLINSSTSSVTGSFLFYGPLSASKAITQGDSFFIAAGDLKITLGGGYGYSAASGLLAHYLTSACYPAPAPTSVTMGLYNVMPSASGWGGTEVTGGGYARQFVGGSPRWSDPFTTGSTTNGSPIVFAHSAPALADWGTIVGFCIYDITSGTRLVYRGSVYPPVTIIAPDGFQFDTGDLRIYSDIGNTVS